jgi:hypothetical protein
MATSAAPVTTRFGAAFGGPTYHNREGYPVTFDTSIAVCVVPDNAILIDP